MLALMVNAQSPMRQGVATAFFKLAKAKAWVLSSFVIAGRRRALAVVPLVRKDRNIGCVG